MNTQTPTRTGSARPLSGAQGAWLVAEREISTRLRSKAFLISTGLILFLVLAGVLFSGFMANSGGFGDETKVAAVGFSAGGHLASSRGAHERRTRRHEGRRSGGG